MKNLTTRKLVFGLLMAFVLAFGVQGIVDAQTPSVSVSGDGKVTSTSQGTTTIYAARLPIKRSFTITVKNAVNGDKVTITPTTAVTVTELDVTTVPTETDSNSNSEDPIPAKRTYTTTTTTTNTANGIAIGGTNEKSTIIFDNLGDSDDGSDDGSSTDEDDLTLGSWTIKVTYEVNKFGKYKLTTTATDSTTITRTKKLKISGSGLIEAYVVQSKTTIQSYKIKKSDPDEAASTYITQTPQTSMGRITSGLDIKVLVQDTESTPAPQEWVQVDLSITNGKLHPQGLHLRSSSSSKIYDTDDANISGYTSLSVFTDAHTATTATTVAGSISNLVDVNPTRNKTATLTAKITGTSGDHARHVVTYFYNTPRIERVSGNYQHALEGERLSQPLVVRVSDGTRNVSNQRVRFTASAGELRPVTRSDFITETDSREGSTAISVKTNSSGQAKVYLTVPSDAAEVTVNAEVAPTPPPVNGAAADDSQNALASLSANTETFTVFAVERDSAVLKDLTIDVIPDTPVENADPNKNEIWVGTTATSPTEVEFTVTGGQLYLDPKLQDLDAISLNRSTDSPKYVTKLRVSTTADGNIGASGSPVLYLKVTSGIAVVKAKILRSSLDNAQREIQYFTGTIELEKVSSNQRVRGALGGLRSDPFVVRALIGGRPAAEQIVKFTHTRVGDSSTLRPVPGTKVFVTSAGGFTLDGSDTSTPASTSVPNVILREETYTANPSNVSTIFVETDSAGEAQVYLQMGTAVDHTVTAALPVGHETVSFTVEPQAGTITGDLTKIDVPDIRPNDDKIDTLAIRAENNFGDRLPGVNIRWTTTHGTIIYLADRGSISDNAAQDENNITNPIRSGQEIFVKTDSYGEVWVLYRRDKDVSSGQTVRSEIASEQSSTQHYDFEISHVTFNIGGTKSPTTTPTTTPTTVTPYLQISVSPSSAAAGSTGTLTVTAYGSTGAAVPGASINLSSTGITNLPSPVTSGQSTSFTFPSSSTTVSARADGYNATSQTITVTTPTTTTSTTTQVASTLSIVSGNSQVVKTNERLDPFVVQIKDQEGKAMSGVEVLFQTGGAGTLSTAKSTTGSNGQASTTLSLPTTQRDFATYTVYATVIGVEGLQQQFTIIARKPVLSRLVVREGNPQSAFVGQRLADPIEVEVLDTDEDPVAGIQVTFTVLSDESTGTATPLTQSDESDAGGYAGAQITPTGAGVIQIQASVMNLTPVQLSLTASLPPSKIMKISGDNQGALPGVRLAKPFVVEIQDADSNPMPGITVTFNVTAGDGTISTTSATTDTNGHAQTHLTLGTNRGKNTVNASVAGVTGSATFSAVAGAKVLVSASQRPPLYWVSGTQGQLHRLVGAAIENLAPNVRGVTSLAIDTKNNLLYFGVKTSEETGAIRRSNLNGSNVQTVLSLTAVPRGIALDSNGSTIYLANSRGRLQRINTQGKARLVTIRENLPQLSAIAVSNGYLYWAEMLGQLRRLSLTAKNPAIQNLATGVDEPTNLSVSKGKVYWTQRNAAGEGRLQQVNLDGTGIQSLKYFASGPPLGFTVNTSENKIYWTLQDGRLQQANIWGQSPRDFVAGLLNPGALVVGPGVAQAPVVSQPTQPTQTTTQQTTQQPTTYSKYDINKDGKINNADTRAVAVAVGQSGTAITNARTDVDGSGTVDVTDIILVLANLDDDVAAPAIDVDFKALDIDFDRVQEQVEMLLASGDRSIAAQRALLYLQHLLASARPDETALLANYPNPFNPETWIPYHLAESTPVRINIYDAQGTLIRVLTVGHQSAGYYTSRSRAAYWDGRNALGERVASGIYFYQLQTDALSPLRKMVILK